MISLEKTRQSLKSLNLALIIINAIFAGLLALGLVALLFAASLLSSASSGQLTPDEQAMLTMAQTVVGPVLIAVFTIYILAYIVVAVMAFRNRSKILANQPSLVPYYIGLGIAALSILTNLLFARLNLGGAIIQGGLIALNAFSIQKAKLLLEQPQSNEETLTN